MILIDYINRQDKSRLLGMAIIVVIVIGYFNYLARGEIFVSILYLLPLSLVSWCAGRKKGSFVALASSASSFVAEWSFGRYYSHPVIYYWNLTMMFTFFFIVNFVLSGFKQALKKEKNLARFDSLTGVTNCRY